MNFINKLEAEILQCKIGLGALVLMKHYKINKNNRLILQIIKLL